MNEYQYTREITGLPLNPAYNIDNPALLDINGLIIRLAIIVQTAFPTKGDIGLVGDDVNVTISTEVALDAVEKLALDLLVANYKIGIIP